MFIIVIFCFIVIFSSFSKKRTAAASEHAKCKYKNYNNGCPVHKFSPRFYLRAARSFTAAGIACFYAIITCSNTSLTRITTLLATCCALVTAVFAFFNAILTSLNTILIFAILYAFLACLNAIFAFLHASLHR